MKSECPLQLGSMEGLAKISAGLRPGWVIDPTVSSRPVPFDLVKAWVEDVAAMRRGMS